MRILFVENHSVFADNVTRHFVFKHTVTVVQILGTTELIWFSLITTSTTARATRWFARFKLRGRRSP